MFRLTLAEAGGATNAKDWAKPFTARLLEPGLVSYEDSGCGIALVRKETIDRCISSFIGRPVVCRKNSKGRLVHETTSPRNMKEVGHGYVTDVFFNAEDGWWYGRGVVDTDEAARAINEVGFCSVGYKPLKNGPGGKWHDIAYHEEILEFTGEHLAIVNAPRYETATIRLNAKNPQESTAMKFAFWKKDKTAPASSSGAATASAEADPTKTGAAAAAAADPAAKENAKAAEIDGDSVIELVSADGKTTEKVTVAQLVEAHNAKKGGEAEIDGDDEVVINGKKVKVNALIEVFNKWERVKPAEPMPKTNSVETADPAKPAAADPARTNAKPDFFRLVQSAPTAVRQPVAHNFGSQREGLDAGLDLYGSDKGRELFHSKHGKN